MKNILTSTSVIKANRKQALEIAVKMKEILHPKSGKPIFRVTITDDLIEIKTPVKENGEWLRDEEGKAIRLTCFRWTKTLIGEKIEWSPEFIKIG